MAEITVYHKRNCIQCKMTMQMLDQARIPYNKVLIEDHPEALAELKAKGFSSAPVVKYGDEMWAGFQPGKIKAAIAVTKG